MPRNISPQIKAKILEEEIKLSVQNSIRDEKMNYEDGHNIEKSKRNTPQNDFVDRKSNIGLMEKIQTIQENLGIDVEALLDKIYDAAERSPHNPLRKIQEKKKSRMTTPEKKSEETQSFFPSENAKKSGIKENSFQTPQRGSKVIENERNPQNQNDITKSSSSNKRSIKEDKIGINMPETIISKNEEHKEYKEESPPSRGSLPKDQRSSIKKHDDNTTSPQKEEKEERKSIKDQKKSLKEEKKSLRFSIKEDPRPDMIPKEEKEKGLLAEIKMDVQLGLDWIYTKVINDVKQLDNRKSVKIEKVGMEILVKSELESLYGAVLGEVL